MAVTICSDTLAWHCPPWGGAIQGIKYDRSAVKPGIVHFGVNDFHKAHQAIYTHAVLSSGAKGCLDWGISGVGLSASDNYMRHTMRKQDCLYMSWTRESPNPVLEVIGSHCEYLYAPDQHQTVLDRLCAASTKIVTLSIGEASYCLNAAGTRLNSEKEDVEEDVKVLKIRGTALRTAMGFLVAAAERRRQTSAPAIAVLSCDPIASNGHKARSSILDLAELAYGEELREYIEDTWFFPCSVAECDFRVNVPEFREELKLQHSVDDRWPAVRGDFSRWIVEDKFPSGRPPWDTVLGGSCQMVQDVSVFERMKLSLLDGAQQAIAYAGILKDYRRVCDAMADTAICEFVEQYIAVTAQHAVKAPKGVDLQAYQRELMVRLSKCEDELFPLANQGCAKLQERCMSCVPSFPKFDMPSVRPLAVVIGCWVRYLGATFSEEGTGYEHAPEDQMEFLQPLATSLWTAAQSAGYGEKPKDLAAEFLAAAFEQDLKETVLQEAMANFLVALNIQKASTALSTLGTGVPGL